MIKYITCCCLIFPFADLLQAQQAGFNRIFPQAAGSHIVNNIITLDDGYMAAGTLADSNTRFVFLTKVGPEGAFEWSKRYKIDTLRTGAGRSGSLKKTLHGGLIIAGELVEPSTSRFWSYIMHFNADGDTLWHFKQKQYGSYEHSAFYNVAQNRDSSYVAVGYAFDSTKNLDLLIAKISAQGNLEWWKTYGDNRWQAGFTIRPTNSGYVVSGGEWAGQDSNPFVTMIDDTGGVVWERIFENTPYNDGQATMHISSDSMIYVGGSWAESDNDPDDHTKSFFAKLSMDNELLWIDTIGSSEKGNTILELREDRNGNILGVTTSQVPGTDGWLVGRVIKVGPEGDSISNTYFDASYMNHFEGASNAWAMDTTLDGGFITAGFVQGSDTVTQEYFQKLWVVKFDSNGCFDTAFNCGPQIDDTTGIFSFHKPDLVLNVWPNPATQSVNISAPGMANDKGHWLEVYSAFGVLRWRQPYTGSVQQVDVSAFPPGTYFCVLRKGTAVIARKRLVVH